MAPETTHNETPKGSLSFLRPQQTDRIRKARGPRTMMRVVRLMLPIVAIVIVVYLAGWARLHPNTVETAVMKNIPDLVIDNLNYSGRDSKNQPYSLTAEKATRPSGVSNIYDLDKPRGELTLQNGAWVSGQAEYGRFDQTKRQLWLGGNVELFHDKGMQFTTDEAQVAIDDRYAWGEKPVLLQGGFGTITGQGFRLLDAGNVMIVKGPAHAVLNLHSGGGSDKPDQAEK